jgi:hypothetical protein
VRFSATVFLVRDFSRQSFEGEDEKAGERDGAPWREGRAPEWLEAKADERACRQNSSPGTDGENSKVAPWFHLEKAKHPLSSDDSDGEADCPRSAGPCRVGFILIAIAGRTGFNGDVRMAHGQAGPAAVT